MCIYMLSTGIYYERLDSDGHAYGPYAINQTIRDLDSELFSMFLLLDKLGIHAAVNSMLVLTIYVKDLFVDILFYLRCKSLFMMGNHYPVNSIFRSSKRILILSGLL